MNKLIGTLGASLILTACNPVGSSDGQVVNASASQLAPAPVPCNAGYFMTGGSCVAAVSPPTLQPKVAPSSNFPTYNLMWYENDNLPSDGRPDNGGWWSMNPNSPGIVPNDGNQYRTATPLLGLYDSSDPNVIRQHGYWLAAMGINGVVVDWSNLNYSILPSYTTSVVAATDALMAEFSQATAAHPTLQVVLAIRLQTSGCSALGCAADFSQVIDEAAALYNKYPAVNLILNNGTPTSTLPLLDVFVDFTPQSAWAVAPQLTDSRFDLRFTNGYLVQRDLTEPVGAGSVARVTNFLPYWNFVENTPDPTQADHYQTVYRSYMLDGVERVEQSAAWLALWQNGFTWDGIAANCFSRSFEPFYTFGPEVLTLNRWNYAIGWYAQPQEGLSLDTATMFQPSQEYGYQLFDQGAQALATARGLTTAVPGNIQILNIDSNMTTWIYQDGWPLEYQLSPNAPDRGATWTMIAPTSAGIPIPTGSSAPNWYVRTRNSFGTSAWQLIPL